MGPAPVLGSNIMYYVYLLKSDNASELYIGYTSDLRRRVAEHNRKGKKHTSRKNSTWTLVYYEAFKSQADAMERERKLKKHGSGKQELYKRLPNSL